MSALDFASIGSTIGRGLMGGQSAYEQGRMKMSQVMAEIGQKQAAANLYNTKAENERQRTAYQSPEAMLPGLAASAGLTVPQFKEFQERHNTGSWGMNPASEDPARQVSIAPTPKSAPDWATPEMQQRARDVIANMYNTFGATGDTNAEQIAKGFKTLTETNRANNAFGSGGAQALNAIMAAEGGKLYSSTPRGILTQETGGENVNPLWAESERALAGQRRAAAAENYAGADHHRASIDKVRSGIGQTQTMTLPDGTVIQTGHRDKEMPVGALKLQNEDLDLIGTSASIAADLAKFEQLIASGGLQLGPVKNMASSAKNWAGMSDENSRNYASMMATLEKSRNDSLRLNKGVQTEGDAQRAWNELFANQNDPAVVVQRLREIQNINDRAINIRKQKVNAVRANYGNSPMNFDEFTNVQSAVGENQKPTQPMPAQQQKISSALANVPSAAIEHLRKNPELKIAFAAKYGKEATDAALGGR